MKVLVVTQYFWPETFPINKLIDGLYNTNCEITVLTGQPNYPEGKIFNGYRIFSFKEENLNGYKIFRVPLIPRGKSGSVRLFINYLFFCFSASICGPFILKRKKFDIVLGVAQSPILAVIPAIILKKIKKVPMVTWVGDLWPESLSSTGYVKNKIILNWVEKLVRWIYANNDLILIQSASFKEPISRLSNNVRIEYLPNPAGAIEDDNGTKMPALILEKGFNIVFAGNLGTVQSLEMIVETANLLKGESDIRFILLGSGSMSDWVNARIQDLNLKNLLLPGRFPPSDIPGILKQADVLLVSLVKDYLMSITVPSKTQTYMAMGKPIIASMDGEGARVVVESGAGFASPAEDPIELAKVILKIKSLSKEKKEKMGKAAFDYFIKNFESSAVANRLKKYLSETIENVKH